MRTLETLLISDGTLARQADRLGLAVPEGELAERVRRQLAARRLGSTVVLVGLLTVGAWLILTGALTTPLLFLSWALFIMLGTLLGEAVGGALAERQLRGPRVAREQAVTIGDYLPAWTRRISWGSAATGLACLLGLTACLAVVQSAWARTGERHYLGRLWGGTGSAPAGARGGLV